MKNAEKYLGGGFSLIQDVEDKKGMSYFAENWTPDVSMIYNAARDFISIECGDKVNKLEEQTALMHLAANQGFTAAHIDEEYGGLGLGVVANTALSEGISTLGGSFNTTFAAHIGIGMLPIYYFGTEEQKKKYLPRLISAEMIASYCLTEPDSGSDALAAKTTATKSKDGKHYLINGQKMWITNAGFADLFIVFAKVDGTKFTCFLIEAETPGIRLGEEEKKMGIKASSTRQVFFEDVKVPIENVLGEIGKGHLIAFNVLNIGRYKLGVMCLGGASTIIQRSVEYASQRFQFGQAIAEFGAIKHKLAEQQKKIFVLDSLVYQLAYVLDSIEKSFEGKGFSNAQASLEAAKEMALECAVVKVVGSECVSYCADENIQIHGGMGFSEETDAPMIYRDARINRIYEGTNEINRLLIVSRLGKMATDNHNSFFEILQESYSHFMNGDNKLNENSSLSLELATRHYRQAVLILIAHCFTYQAMGKINLEEDQQTAMAIADVVIEWMSLDSVVDRLSTLQNHTDNNRAAEIIALLQMNQLHRTLLDKGTQAFLSTLRESDNNEYNLLRNWQDSLVWQVREESSLRTELANMVIKKGYNLFRNPRA